MQSHYKLKKTRGVRADPGLLKVSRNNHTVKLKVKTIEVQLREPVERKSLSLTKSDNYGKSSQTNLLKDGLKLNYTEYVMQCFFPLK